MTNRQPEPTMLFDDKRSLLECWTRKCRFFLESQINLALAKSVQCLKVLIPSTWYNFDNRIFSWTQTVPRILSETFSICCWMKTTHLKHSVPGTPQHHCYLTPTEQPSDLKKTCFPLGFLRPPSSVPLTMRQSDKNNLLRQEESPD